MALLSDTAMVLAAGLGMRMRPLTLEKPKPLFEVGGRTMLDAALDKLAAIGIKSVVVNTFYLPEMIADHLKDRRDMEIVISNETELLDTGGGIKNALRYFDRKPFFALNADLPWMDAKVPSLRRMKDAWNPEQMDALLLLMPTKKARGFIKGDFMMRPDGHVWRKNAPAGRPYVMLSAQILKPQLFEGISERVFSNNKIWNAAEDAGKLYGLVHEGTCYHVGTPDDLAKANGLLVTGQGWGA